MYTRISIQFKSEAGKTPFWPCHVFRTNQAVAIQECILAHTGNHDLAAEVSGLADLAGIGETYDCDELSALIIDD